MSGFQFVVLAPATGCGTVERPSLALAACRAGEIGVLDVEFGVDLSRLEQALSTGAKANVGLRLRLDLLERFSLTAVGSERNPSRQGFKQPVGIDRFRNVIVHARFQAFLDIAGHGMSRHC
ncbi:MAG: hypothetical protein K2Z81_11150, partial [Cyanobacteria bacterium]|nr:hypothetical protein [Cyanobacteriota bacterium]